MGVGQCSHEGWGKGEIPGTKLRGEDAKEETTIASGGSSQIYIKIKL